MKSVIVKYKYMYIVDMNPERTCGVAGFNCVRLLRREELCFPCKVDE